MPAALFAQCVSRPLRCAVLAAASNGGFNIERGDNYGQTLVHLAALRGNVRAAKAAMELGASPETRDGQARRPIELVKEKLLKARQEQGKLAALSRRRGSDEPDMPDVDTALFVKHMEVEHLLQPTWRSRIEQAPDKAYYVVMLATAVAEVGYIKILYHTPYEVATHMIFLFTQATMHITWQLTRRTDPGTFGLRDESIYRAEYRVAVDEMCERGTKEWSLGGHRRLCHTCMIVRPLRSKHSPALAVDKCVPRFDHHCPWVGNTVGFENHPMFVAYTVSTWVCLGMSCWLCLRFLADKSVWDEPAVLTTLVICVFFTVFTIVLSAAHVHFCVLNNVTTNEQMNWDRYPHFAATTRGAVKTSPFHRGCVSQPPSCCTTTVQGFCTPA